MVLCSAHTIQYRSASQISQGFHNWCVNLFLVCLQIKWIINILIIFAIRLKSFGNSAIFRNISNFFPQFTLVESVLVLCIYVCVWVHMRYISVQKYSIVILYFISVSIHPFGVHACIGSPICLIVKKTTHTYVWLAHVHQCTTTHLYVHVVHT